MKFLVLVAVLGCFVQIQGKDIAETEVGAEAENESHEELIKRLAAMLVERAQAEAEEKQQSEEAGKKFVKRVGDMFAEKELAQEQEKREEAAEKELTAEEELAAEDELAEVAENEEKRKADESEETDVEKRKKSYYDSPKCSDIGEKCVHMNNDNLFTSCCCQGVCSLATLRCVPIQYQQSGYGYQQNGGYGFGQQQQGHGYPAKKSCHTIGQQCSKDGDCCNETYCKKSKCVTCRTDGQTCSADNHCCQRNGKRECKKGSGISFFVKKCQ